MSVRRGQRGSVRLLTGRTTLGLYTSPEVTTKGSMKPGEVKSSGGLGGTELNLSGYNNFNYWLIKEIKPQGRQLLHSFHV